MLNLFALGYLDEEWNPLGREVVLRWWGVNADCRLVRLPANGMCSKELKQHLCYPFPSPFNIIIYRK